MKNVRVVVQLLMYKSRFRMRLKMLNEKENIEGHAKKRGGHKMTRKDE